MFLHAVYLGVIFTHKINVHVVVLLVRTPYRLVPTLLEYTLSTQGKAVWVLKV